MSYVARAFGPQGFGAYEIQWNGTTPQFLPSTATPELLLVPGFIDIHIHGAFGIDFMESGRFEMERLCGLLAEQGYEAFLPTTVSTSSGEVNSALASIPNSAMVPGFHLEGPFLSPDHPGAQPPEAIVDPPNAGSEWDAILDHPKLKIVTLAPERPGAEALIKRLASRGVAVSMGHSHATFGQARMGFKWGARNTTHTFNAMRGFHHREPGLAGFALTEDRLFAELIYDRKHVSREVADVLFRCKPKDKVIAVSDSSMATGMSAGKVFSMWGLEVETWERSVYLKGTQTLAGSAITLLDAFRNLATDFGEETAIRCCSLNPRSALGISGSPGVYVELDQRLEIVGIRQVPN